jgi:hypothetical protein
MARLWGVFDRRSCNLVSALSFLSTRRYLARLEGSFYQPSRSALASCKLRLWKPCGSSHVSRPAPSKVPAHDAESDDDRKSIDIRHKSSSASNLPRRSGRWFPRYKARSTPNRYDRPDSFPGKQGMAVTGAQDGVSGSDCRIGCGNGPNTR